MKALIIMLGLLILTACSKKIDSNEAAKKCLDQGAEKISISVPSKTGDAYYITCTFDAETLKARAE
ncbi:hypothetical protein [Nitrincola iocasae]|uniref:Uncharacterized protein n=1 Tax=Nitrincola iocasae TaxID=2614693 RepID=A0A5J6LAU7_9GAMM|nr:hypothetical protein [Nitrincola iocasae]QEW05647.1 hypothetical protein F5I99_03605 [Nitrincola iocasae]